MLRRFSLKVLIVVGAAALASCSTNTSNISIGPNFPTLSLYVSNATQNAISIYPANPTSSSTPVNEIGGSNTLLNGPQYDTFDSMDRLYVTNFNAGLQLGSITVYQAQATGNVIPLGVFTGTTSGLGHPRGIATDGSGDLFVANVSAPPQNISSIVLFGANTFGSPGISIAGSATGLNVPVGIKVDSNGNIDVSNSGNATIETFGKGVTGNVAPTSTIGGPATTLATPTGLSLDSKNNIYVADASTNAIDIFAAGASGNVAPTAVIAGSNTKLNAPSDVELDSSGNIYVASNNTILIFPPSASGNVAPSQAIPAPFPGTLIGIAIVP
ncbi:MAG: NHL repeat-containing protein [Candidatus Eremiobacteraeota bacterium]|nr:NHL repeat-containing protein [Candidatus Eremiobacteraeota bacterium]